jgi:hypothetical protein
MKDLTAYRAEYYKKNKKRILERSRKKLLCEHCNKEYTYSYFSAHKKTKRHKNNMTQTKN